MRLHIYALGLFVVTISGLAAYLAEQILSLQTTSGSKTVPVDTVEFQLFYALIISSWALIAIFIAAYFVNF